jgi:predicted ester cyclase
VSSEENKAVVRRLYEEVFNGGNLDLADDLVAPDGVNHAAPPGGPAGPVGVRRIVGMLRAAFPDDRHEIEDMLAEGDRVAVRITHTGTHEGVFRGAPPRGGASNSPRCTCCAWRAARSRSTGLLGTSWA